MRARGLDVSEVQGKIDFAAVRAAGFDFVYVKCTEGAHYVDPDFVANVEHARSVGLLVGAYHFLTPQASVADQLDAFLSAVAKVSGLDLPAMVDFEFPTPEHWSQGGTTLAPRCLEMARGVRDATGFAPVIYEYPYFDNALPPSPELVALVAEFLLAIASYHDEAHEPKDGDHPTIPKHWTAKGWTLWQWSGDHSKKEPGIFGVADHEVYNGTIDELRAWLGSIDNPYAHDAASEQGVAQPG